MPPKENLLAVTCAPTSSCDKAAVAQYNARRRESGTSIATRLRLLLFFYLSTMRPVALLRLSLSRPTRAAYPFMLEPAVGIFVPGAVTAVLPVAW
jgi:hypothetical protein